VSMTTTAREDAGTKSAGTSNGEKDFWDALGSVLPGIATTLAPTVGIDPRMAGQTVSQVLNLFGVGGPGKAFTAAIPKGQAASQLQQVVSPHLNDPAFAKALGVWLAAAVEPVQAHKEGKAYQPDLTKNWLDDIGGALSGAVSSVGDFVSGVDWGQVAQVGMQALPYVMALL
jgi:hypothetical protein